MGHHSHISLKIWRRGKSRAKSAPVQSSKFKVPNGESRRCTRLPNISFVRSWIRRKRGKKWNVTLRHTKTNIQFSPMLRNMPVKEEHCKKVTSRATNYFEYNEFQMSSRFDRHAESKRRGISFHNELPRSLDQNGYSSSFEN